MARSARKDPLDKFRFIVTIDNFAKAGFNTAGTPGVEINSKEYQEGGRHMNPVLIVDGASFKPVTFSRGVTTNGDFYNWAKQPFELVYGKKEGGDFGLGKVYRKDITIDHMDRRGRIIKQYILKNAIPASYTAASDFGATADDGFSIESLTVKYEGFVVRTIDKDGNLSSIDPREILKRGARRIPF